MLRKIAVAIAAAAAALAFAGTAGAGAASASVIPHAAVTVPHSDGGVVTSVANEDGAAGYFTDAFGQNFTQVNATFSLNLAAQNIGTDCSIAVTTTPCPAADIGFPPKESNGDPAGGIGVQLCDPSTGDAAQLGAVYIGGGEWEVAYGSGSFTPVAGGGDPCDGVNGILQGSKGRDFNVVAAQMPLVPTGDSVQVEIRQAGGVLYFLAADIHDGVEVTYYAVPVPTRFSYFGEAGAGAFQDPELVSACAGLGSCPADLSDFSGVTATSDGITQGFAYWSAFQVASTDAGGAVFADGQGLTPSSESCTFTPGHREYFGSFGHRHYYDHGRKWVWVSGDRHYVWIKGYTTCTGGGASSFSVDTGLPTGV